MSYWATFWLDGLLSSCWCDVILFGRGTPHSKSFCRSILLIRLLAAMGIMFVLEQPCHASTGGLESLRRFQELISDLVDPYLQWQRHCSPQTINLRLRGSWGEVYRARVVMEAFAAPTLKPSWLYSNHRRLQACPFSWEHAYLVLPCPTNTDR